MVERLDGWSVRARTTAISAIVVPLLVLLAVWPIVDAWTRSALLFSDVVLQLPVRPIELFSADPSTVEVSWSAPDRDGRGFLTLPGRGDDVPGIVLVLGARPAAPDDPRVERLVDSLARLGFAVLLPVSEDLDEGRVLPAEVDRLVGAWQRLAQEPRVADDRVGYLGLSAGGSLALAASSNPTIAEAVRFVVAVGPYFDAGELMVATVSRSFVRPDGTLEAWAPRRITRAVVEETLLSTLDAAERASIEAGAAPSTPAGEAVAALLAGTERSEAEAIVDGIAGAQRAAIDGISPSAVIDGLEAELYLLHDRADRFVPWPASEEIAAAHEPVVYHRLDLFEHVEPNVGAVGPLLRDGWRLHRLFVRLFRELR
jgi:acetyl esterase/lipase